MNLSDLKVGMRAKITSTRVDCKDFSFSGEVKTAQDSTTKKEFLWLTNNEKMGYIISPEYDYLWKVQLLK